MRAGKKKEGHLVKEAPVMVRYLAYWEHWLTGSTGGRYHKQPRKRGGRRIIGLEVGGAYHLAI